MKKHFFSLFIAFVALTELFSQRLPDLIPYRKDSLWGYCDSAKKIIIEPKYEEANFFKDGIALIKKEGSYGYINSSGNNVTEIKYSDIRPFVNGFALFSTTEEETEVQGYLDMKMKEHKFPNKKRKRPFDFDDLVSSDFFKGFAVFEEWAEKVYVIDTNFKIILKIDAISEGGWGGGYDWKDRGNKPDQDFLILMKFDNDEDAKLGVIDPHGNEIIPFKYDEIKNINGMLHCRKDSIWSRIDLGNNNKRWKGNYESPEITSELLADKFKDRIIFYDTNETKLLEWTFAPNWGWFYSVKNYQNGVINVGRGDAKWGYINIEGKELCEFKYDYASPFSGDIALAFLNGKYAIIDRNFKELTGFEYEKVDMTSENLVCVWINYKKGYMDKYGTKYWDD